MKASDALAKLLAYKKVHYGFELIGGMITHLVDSINQLGQTKLISVHHEQGAAFAAGGVARATDHQILGVALGTTGPGATNLITGIADCWLDNVPCIFLTGQVNTHESKGNKNIKQQGFQELDIIALVHSITKYAKKIDTVEELLPELNKAIDIACSGRPGPVLLDIPMNIQCASIEEEKLDALITAMPSVSDNEGFSAHEVIVSEVVKIYEELLNAKQPLVLFGGGAVNTPFLSYFITHLEQLNIPYVASLKGSEKIVKSNYYFGMIGSYGKRVANYAIQNCDLLLVLGSRLDVRQTGANCENFANNAKIIQIDIDENQLNNRVKVDRALKMDSNNFYQAFNQLSTDRVLSQEWLELLNQKRKFFDFDEYEEYKLSPFQIFNLINLKFQKTSVQYVCDVGNNQMWAAHAIELQPGQKIHHSGGLGAMGFSIPTALGIQLATGSPVVSFSGDGGAHLNIQELDIIARENLPIFIIIFNNKALGMVKNFQDMYFDERNSSTYWKTYTCDFVKIAKGYNLSALRIKDRHELSAAIDVFIHHPKPMLIEIDMDSIFECRPRLFFGDKLDEQSPKMIINQNIKQMVNE